MEALKTNVVKTIARVLKSKSNNNNTSKIYTKVEIRFNKKKGCYIISIEYKDGERQTGMSGSKIYIIGEYYVLTGLS